MTEGKFAVAVEVFAPEHHRDPWVSLAPVSESCRGTCSWTNHFTGRDPEILDLSDR